MLKKLISLLVIFLVLPNLINAELIDEDLIKLQDKDIVLDFTSIKSNVEDIVVITDKDPLFGPIGAYVSCWYNNNISGLKPLMVRNKGILSERQEKFIDTYLDGKDGSLLVLGEHLETDYDTIEILGDVSEVSIETAKHVFVSCSAVIIISKEIDNYQKNIVASPLASYLDIPILIFDNNTNDISDLCNNLNVSTAFVIGDCSINLSDINITKLTTIKEIQDAVLTVISQKFSEINYITMTNPSDVIPPYINKKNQTVLNDHVSNLKITALAKGFDIFGCDYKKYDINIPEGINRLQIYINITNNNFYNPIIFSQLYDSNNNILAYSSSLALDDRSAYLETLTCNVSDPLTLNISFYNGIKGGYFSQRGLSFVNTDYEITLKISMLYKPHLPLIPKLSIIAPYLTSAHGGIILADSNFELTNQSYQEAAQGCGTGPWFEEKLHNFTNEKVQYNLEQLNDTLIQINDFDMLDNFLSGPAWLAILGGTNMIPMYYYGPSQQGLFEKGLASDNLYSLNWSLSVGRVIGWNLQDVSLMVARTFFYEKLCGSEPEGKNWHNKFSFIFGEGFGETGGFFHQIPYSQEIKEYGFYPRIFGDFRNSRQAANLFKTYVGSNYIEYLGHGDWFWFTPSLYGLDFYSKAIDVAHAKNWNYEKPSVFLTSACLMGRVDGIPPQTNIGLAMLHAGCNCFVGATRTTGSEAGLSTLENHLIIDDFSIGEALRGEKRIDKEVPNYFVRVLFGDPAFNPYEPNNGFSNQGRPLN